MQTEVKLQSSISMPWIWLTFAILLLVAGIVFFFIKKRQNKPVVQKPVVPQKIARSYQEIIFDYMNQLNQLEMAYRNQAIEDRETFYKVSEIIRKFVHEVTGIEVTNFSLGEIQRLRMPQLAALINECYHPEFAEEQEEQEQKPDALATIYRTKEVMGTWNLNIR